MNSRFKEYLSPFIFFLIIFGLWEFLAINTSLPTFLFPKPTGIIAELFRRFPYLIEHLLITLRIALLGYIIANVLSFLTAIIFVHFKKVERILYPYIIALKIAPILALSPFIVLLFGIGVVSKIIIVIIVCFFPFLVNVVSGLQITDQAKLDLFHSLSASKSQIFFKLRLPNSLSYIFPALKLTSTLAITGAFVGEFIASNKGIGYVVLIATRTLKTETALAAITLIVVTGIMLFTLIDLLEKKILFWQKPN
jgi:NitT/TauT family transport system permease protein